jgi:hypothetical protein
MRRAMNGPQFRLVPIGGNKLRDGTATPARIGMTPFTAVMPRFETLH